MKNSKKLFKISHKLHKWLMLFVGTQFVIWSVTGAYMVFFDIDYIHGDSLIVNHQTTINSEQLTYPTQKLFQQYPQAKNLSVGVLINREVYRFSVAEHAYTVDAATGELLSPLSEPLAIAVAKHLYSGNGDVINAELITENPPFELHAKHLPTWRIDFDNIGSPALYVSANSGEVVTKRHDFWRLFDWMFRFHVMDYNDGENINNWLLLIIALLALLAALSGLVLTYFKVLKTILINRSKSKILNSGTQ